MNSGISLHSIFLFYHVLWTTDTLTFAISSRNDVVLLTLTNVPKNVSHCLMPASSRVGHSVASNSYVPLGGAGACMTRAH